jgi:hypothetical protein
MWRRRDSNPRPNDYEPFALPLSYPAEVSRRKPEVSSQTIILRLLTFGY